MGRRWRLAQQPVLAAPPMPTRALPMPPGPLDATALPIRADRSLLRPNRDWACGRTFPCSAFRLRSNSAMCTSRAARSAVSRATSAASALRYCRSSAVSAFSDPPTAASPPGLLGAIRFTAGFGFGACRPGIAGDAGRVCGLMPAALGHGVPLVHPHLPKCPSRRSPLPPAHALYVDPYPQGQGHPIPAGA